jgi:hypothetical protein
MDERPRSLLLSLLLLPLAVALMAPLFVCMLLWFYVGAISQGVWLMLRRILPVKQKAKGLQPPHFSQIVSKRITTNRP